VAKAGAKAVAAAGGKAVVRSTLTNLVAWSESSLALSRALATKKTMASLSVQRQDKGTSSSMVT